MHRRYDLTRMILASVIILVLLLMVAVDAQARIAFAADRKGGWENFEIYVMDADGGNQQRLTENRVFDEDPSWSPDGKRIVFWSNREADIENTEIYVMDADGGILKTSPIIRMVTLILHGLTHLFRFLPPAKGLQCGDGSNRLTDNCHY